ncbi:MAG: SH3 domain-containing protein [Anaerolineales bacterium]
MGPHKEKTQDKSTTTSRTPAPAPQTGAPTVEAEAPQALGQFRSSRGAAPPQQLLTLQRAAGNRATSRLIQTQMQPRAASSAPAIQRAPNESQGAAFDSQVSEKLKTFMDSFTFKIRVGEQEGEPVYVSVQTPYHMNAGTRKTNAEQNRNAASQANKTLLASTNWNSRHGKADPESLRTLVQSAVDQGLITPSQPDALLTGQEIRAWMMQYGIGVDCSGFVSQALNSLTGDMARQTGSAAPTAFKVADTGSGSLNWKASSGKFEQVAHPADLRAGDTMWQDGSVDHIIIITGVTQTSGGTVFQTAESSGSKGVHDDTYRCPDPQGDFSDLEKKSGETWVSKSGTFRFSRYKALAAMRGEDLNQPAEDAASETEVPIGSAKVTANVLNVRQGPGTGHEVVGQLPQGTEVQVLKQEGGWLKILFGERTAYVHGNYAEFTPAPVAPEEQAAAGKKGSLWGRLGSFFGSVAKGIGSAAKGVAKGIGSAARGVGNFFGSLFSRNGERGGRTEETSAPAVEPVIATGVVTASALNVRQRPTVDGTQVGTLRQGAQVEVTGKEGAWLRIHHAGKAAYVHGGYVRLQGEGQKPEAEPAAEESAHDDVTITFGANANSGILSAYTLGVLKGILAEAGEKSALITSTIRTPADQARIMYNNIVTYGVAAQKRLYGAGGDAVIDVYAAQKSAGAGETEIRKAMEEKIVAIGSTSVSRHCSDPAVLQVVDIAPSSIQNGTAFAAALQAAKAAGKVSKFIPPPTDPAYHIEIPQ